MGFSVESAKEMLEKHNGDVERAVEELASNLGRPDDQPVAGIRIISAVFHNQNNFFYVFFFRDFERFR